MLTHVGELELKNCLTTNQVIRQAEQKSFFHGGRHWFSLKYSVNGSLLFLKTFFLNQCLRAMFGLLFSIDGERAKYWYKSSKMKRSHCWCGLMCDASMEAQASCDTCYTWVLKALCRPAAKPRLQQCQQTRSISGSAGANAQQACGTRRDGEGRRAGSRMHKIKLD